MDMICRFCCSSECVSNNIFDESNTLLEKCSLYLPIKVTKGDGLPQKICDKCSYKVNYLYQFCNKVLEVQKKFKRLLDEEKVECNPSTHRLFNNKALVAQCDNFPQAGDKINSPNVYNVAIIEESKHVSQYGNNIQPKEEINTPYINDYEIKKESDDDDDDNDNNVSQYDNNTWSKEEINTVCINNVEIKLEPVLASPNYDKANLNNYYSDLDNISDLAFFDSDNELLSNNIKMRKPLVNCKPREENGTVQHQKIGEMTKTKLDTRNPEKILVLKKVTDMQERCINTYYCCVCLVQIKTSKLDMLNHYKGHEDKSYLQNAVPEVPSMPENRRCERCRKTVGESLWGTHWRSHWMSDRRPYRCGICGSGYKKHASLFNHGKTHKIGEKPHTPMSNWLTCDICPEQFMHLRSLLTHRTRVHPQNAGRAYQLACNECGRKFSQLSSLNRHRLTHTTERPTWTCDYCGKSLKNRNYLISHIRAHIGDKCNVCGTCGKSFVRLDHLKLHQRIHSRENPYVCSHCGKSFSQKSPLVIHERYHSGVRPYACELCGRAFASKGLMSFHLKTCPDRPPPVDMRGELGTGQ